MKRTKLLLAPLLIVMGLHAKPAESESTTPPSNIKTGTTLGHYAKPGAPIDMTYSSKAVEAEEVTDINITLTTNVRFATMNVELSWDKELTKISKIAEKLTYQVTPEYQTFHINLRAKSTEEGLFYIRLLTKIDKGTSSQMRSFAVPVYVGENPHPKNQTSQIQKVMGGENISISKAVETIEVLEE